MECFKLYAKITFCSSSIYLGILNNTWRERALITIQTNANQLLLLIRITCINTFTTRYTTRITILKRSI